MKKVIFSAVLMTALISCKKEEMKDCNCGVIQSDNASNFSVDIKNDCSGNVKNFTLAEADWMNAYVGSNYCISNINNW